MKDIFPVLVNFRRNKKIREIERGEESNARKSGFTSKFVGFFQDGRIGVVFPGNTYIEGILDKLETIFLEPWVLQVFIHKTNEVYLAYKVVGEMFNFERFMAGRFDTLSCQLREIIKRLDHLESSKE